MNPLLKKKRSPEPASPPPAASSPSASDPELLAQRDRLVERFAVVQSELGGLFYEMAIRDHVKMDVLMPKAAALQRIDAELGQIERLLATDGIAVGGACPACGTTFARGSAFCAHCAHPLTA